MTSRAHDVVEIMVWLTADQRVTANPASPVIWKKSAGSRCWNRTKSTRWPSAGASTATTRRTQARQQSSAPRRQDRHGLSRLRLADLRIDLGGQCRLIQAVKRFEPDKGFRLATYATWWIKAAIQEYILRSCSLVKMGTTANQKKLFFNLRKAKSKISVLDEEKCDRIR